MNLSFAGCGFLGIYHVGVAVCFKQYAPHLLLHKISGASAGALAACCLLCDMPLGEMTSDFFRVVNEARSHSLGPFSPSFNIQTSLLEGLQKFLPADAHLRVNGRLHISLTRVYDGKNVIVSQYNSREDLLQALMCACFIPIFSGILPPRFRGIRYMDGAFSDNLPTLDENTVTVSPFCGESDICPRDQSSQLFHVNLANTSIELSRQNINRFARILFPARAEVLSNMCHQGFDDALRFLHRNNLISCTRCLSVQSTFIVSETTVPEIEDYDPECKECVEHRKEAQSGNMPDTVLTVFQTYIESANKGIMNWVFRHRGAKLIKALSLPATVPADFMYATLTKILGTAPTIGSQIWHLSKYFLNHLNSKLMLNNKSQIKANLTCQLALTECGKQPVSHSRSHHPSECQLDMMDDLDEANKQLVAFNNNISKSDNEMITNNDEDAAFGQIFETTSNQEAVYSYFFMDENNKVKINEIFDMTGNEDPSIQTKNERELNEQLQYDSDWDNQTDFMYETLSNANYASNMIENDEEIDIDTILSNSQTNLFQTPSVRIEEITNDDDSYHHQTEVDQSTSLLSKSSSNILNKPLEYSSVNFI